MLAADVDTKTYTPHSIRSASSTFAKQLGLSTTAIKVHANWSLNSSTFENYYFKPIAQESQGAKITEAIFSFTAEKGTTSEPE